MPYSHSGSNLQGSKESLAATARKRAEEAQGALLSPGALREIVESVVVAFVLAFLFRTFEVEAFVIPTGSMAPTLMGRHKDVTCPKCGYPYRVSASSEVDSQGRPAGTEVVAGTCPMCRFTADLSKSTPPDRGSDEDRVRVSPVDQCTSFKGDRIVVGKFNYQIHDPERWDVAVFRFPNDAKTNFIKRIAGLPKETLRIWQGDVWTKPDGADDFTIKRKPPEKILATMQAVYDNDFVLPKVLRTHGFTRWRPRESDAGPGAWQASADLRSFRTEGAGREETWLEYRHVVPTYDDWAQLLTADRASSRKRSQAAPSFGARPQLINDLTAYNSEEQRASTKNGGAATLPFESSTSARAWPTGRRDRLAASIGSATWCSNST